MPAPTPLPVPHQNVLLKRRKERFTKCHVSSIDYYWKQAKTLPDPGEYFHSIEYQCTSPSFRIRSSHELRYPDCVIRKDAAGPILQCMDMDTNVGDKKHLDCIKPRTSTAVSMNRSIRNVHEYITGNERHVTPGPADYAPEDAITHTSAVGGVLPRGRRLSCFDVAYRDHRSVDFGELPIIPTIPMYNKPRASTVSFSRAHLNTERFDMPCPNKPKINTDTAGPIYNPNANMLYHQVQVTKIGTEPRSWVNPLKREMYAKLENPARYKNHPSHRKR